MGFFDLLSDGLSMWGTSAAADEMASAIREATAVQAGIQREAIAEQRGQVRDIGDYRGVLREDFGPYRETGKKATTAVENLLGLGTNQSQQQAIDQLQQTPLFQSMLKSGEDSILRKASATGGLRGGNTQAALAQFAPNLLAQVMQSQVSNLQPMMQMGLSGVSQGGQLGNQTFGLQNDVLRVIAGLMENLGAIEAGGILGAGNVNAQKYNQMANIGGSMLGNVGDMFKLR